MSTHRNDSYATNDDDANEDRWELIDDVLEADDLDEEDVFTSNELLPLLERQLREQFGFKSNAELDDDEMPMSVTSAIALSTAAFYR